MNHLNEPCLPCGIACSANGKKLPPAISSSIALLANVVASKT